LKDTEFESSEIFSEGDGDEGHPSILDQRREALRRRRVSHLLNLPPSVQTFLCPASMPSEETFSGEIYLGFLLFNMDLPRLFLRRCETYNGR